MLYLSSAPLTSTSQTMPWTWTYTSLLNNYHWKVLMLEKLLHETNQIKFSTSDYHLHVLTCLYNINKYTWQLRSQSTTKQIKTNKIFTNQTNLFNCTIHNVTVNLKVHHQSQYSNNSWYVLNHVSKPTGRFNPHFICLACQSARFIKFSKRQSTVI